MVHLFPSVRLSPEDKWESRQHESEICKRGKPPKTKRRSTATLIYKYYFSASMSSNFTKIVFTMSREKRDVVYYGSDNNSKHGYTSLSENLNVFRLFILNYEKTSTPTTYT